MNETLDELFDEHITEVNTTDSDSDGKTIENVRNTVESEFDEEMWKVTEAILSTHATLLIEPTHNCTGLILVGESGAGKTTAIRLLEGLDEQVYRSDEITPASFVSQDASLNEDELEAVDLLPRIKHKSLVCRDMATWFSGEWSIIHQRMSRMAHVMDGDGFTRDSGSHGKRGYEGDYRFTFIGATTPLSPRAWDVMGHTGQRFVFYEKQSRDEDRDSVKEDLFGDKEYAERIEACREVVHEFLQQLWEEHGGYNGVDDFDATDDAEDALVYLGQVVKYSRATLTQTAEDGYEVSREHMRRVVAVLRDIARGRALLDGRTTVRVKDVQVSARIALSTMPRKRRPLVRALLNPANREFLMANQVEEILNVSRPTAITRMKQLDTLGIAECVEVENDGRETKVLKLNSDFEWPDELDFPEIGSE